MVFENLSKKSCFLKVAYLFIAKIICLLFQNLTASILRALWLLAAPLHDPRRADC